MSTRTRESSRSWLWASLALACVLLSKAPTASACSCARVAPESEATSIASADVAFIGKLVEVRHEPNIPLPPSYWETFMQKGLRSVLERWLLGDMDRHDQTVYVFDDVQTLKQPTPRRMIVIYDGRRTDCDSSREPDLSKAIGKRLRVLAYQPGDADSRSATSLLPRVSFSFCDGAASTFKIVSEPLPPGKPPGAGIDLTLRSTFS